jgi:hypothetical protein
LSHLNIDITALIPSAQNGTSSLFCGQNLSNSLNASSPIVWYSFRSSLISCLTCSLVSGGSIVETFFSSSRVCEPYPLSESIDTPSSPARSAISSVLLLNNFQASGRSLLDNFSRTLSTSFARKSSGFGAGSDCDGRIAISLSVWAFLALALFTCCWFLYFSGR